MIAVAQLSVAGAAYTTATGYILQSIIGVAFFLINRKGQLYFVRPKFDGKALLKTCSNGMSEMVEMLAITVTMIAMNVILMKLSGSDGVAAAAIILSVQTILSASYVGYIEGIASITSFHYGAGNTLELQTLFRATLKTIAIMSAVTFAISFPLAKPIALLFAGGSQSVIFMAVRGTFIFAAAFLLMGFNLFASGFFTALNNGKISATISLSRTLIFLIIPLLTLPTLLGVNGVWLSIPIVEILIILLSTFFLKNTNSNIIMHKGEYYEIHTGQTHAAVSAYG